MERFQKHYTVIIYTILFNRKFVDGPLIKINKTQWISQMSIEIKLLWMPHLKYHFN